MQKAKLEMTAGLALAAAAVLFIAWGVWKAVTPEPVPLQGMMDARTVSVAAKVPGRLGEVTVEEGTLVKAGDTVARLLVPEIEAKVAQAKAAQTAAGAQAEMAEEGSRVQAVAAAKADVIRAEAGADLAKKTYERVAALFADGLVSVQKRDEALAQKKNSWRRRKRSFPPLPKAHARRKNGRRPRWRIKRRAPWRKPRPWPASPISEPP